MENHSFDNLLGDLGRTRTDVGALHRQLGRAGEGHPGGGGAPGTVTAFPLTNTAQTENVTQTRKATHEQVNGGAMDGFVRSSSRALLERPRGRA